ncbi:hypothetical protein FHETE_10511 [Fusarium heterosporum]|uniref:Uncharacterized protein n=1 Tax=Fusarium heterosporum TaxID=42747 RepID=A0A8H5WGG0_FUSHE|nr:hypothetical protein FHETE_10511 [Fusarium heterosporum]
MSKVSFTTLSVLRRVRDMSSRRLDPMSISRSGASGQSPGVYDYMGKDLEFGQSMYEHGEAQVVPGGDCNDEIGKVQKRLGEVSYMAKTEMDPIRTEESELPTEKGEAGKVQTRWPVIMSCPSVSKRAAQNRWSSQNPPI